MDGPLSNRMRFSHRTRATAFIVPFSLDISFDTTRLISLPWSLSKHSHGNSWASRGLRCCLRGSYWPLALDLPILKSLSAWLHDLMTPSTTLRLRPVASNFDTILKLWAARQSNWDF